MSNEMYSNNLKVLSIENMGFTPEQLAQIKGIVNYKGGGIILIAGRTYSGKTTTIQNLLRAFDEKFLPVTEFGAPIEFISENHPQVSIDKTIDYEIFYRNLTPLAGGVIVRDHLDHTLVSLEKEAQLAAHGTLIIGEFFVHSGEHPRSRLADLPQEVRQQIKMVVYQSLDLEKGALHFNAELFTNSQI